MIRRTAHVVAVVLALALAGVGSASAAPLVPPVPGPTVPGVSVPGVSVPGFSLPGLSRPALGAGSNITVGPIPIPAVSLQVCVNGTCQTAPQVTALTVRLKGSAGVLGTPPVLLPVACSSGVGIGVRTVPGTLGAVTGSVTLTTAGAGTVSVPISQSVGTSHGLTVSACSV
jgi:hypothetical protein